MDALVLLVHVYELNIEAGRVHDEDVDVDEVDVETVALLWM